MIMSPPADGDGDGDDHDDDGYQVASTCKMIISPLVHHKKNNLIEEITGGECIWRIVEIM